MLSVDAEVATAFSVREGYPADCWARLQQAAGSAADIPSALAKFDLPAPDVILSGIPFSTMPRALAGSSPP